MSKAECVRTSTAWHFVDVIINMVFIFRGNLYRVGVEIILLEVPLPVSPTFVGYSSILA